MLVSLNILGWVGGPAGENKIDEAEKANKKGQMLIYHET